MTNAKIFFTTYLMNSMRAMKDVQQKQRKFSVNFLKNENAEDSMNEKKYSDLENMQDRKR